MDSVYVSMNKLQFPFLAKDRFKQKKVSFFKVNQLIHKKCSMKKSFSKILNKYRMNNDKKLF